MLTLLEGRGLVESHRWHAGRLWFADWIAGEVIADDEDGKVEVIIRHESMPLCFDFLPDGTPSGRTSESRDGCGAHMDRSSVADIGLLV